MKKADGKNTIPMNLQFFSNDANDKPPADDANDKNTLDLEERIRRMEEKAESDRKQAEADRKAREKAERALDERNKELSKMKEEQNKTKTDKELAEEAIQAANETKRQYNVMLATARIEASLAGVKLLDKEDYADVLQVAVPENSNPDLEFVDNLFGKLVTMLSVLERKARKDERTALGKDNADPLAGNQNSKQMAAYESKLDSIMGLSD